MKGIFELKEVSNYRPTKGLLSFEMLEMVEKGFGRDHALAEWVASGRSADSFRQVLKKLKDNLLQDLFSGRMGLEPNQLKRIECWEKFCKVKCLMIADKRTAAMEIATEVIHLAQKCGFTEIVLSLAIQLEFYFGAMAPDKQRYLRYRRIRKKAVSDLEWEQKAGATYSKLFFIIKSNKDWRTLAPEIEELKKAPPVSLLFLSIRCSLLTAWYELCGEYKKMISTIEEAIAHIMASSQWKSPFILVNLYLELLPILIAQKRFTKAERYLNTALQHPQKGSYTWH
ncbi:MAG TPA: hypothetical protein ENJ20_00380, partial [Bacteroidetes bacterium]|nr:hypothetical protein [Bacteroidota bacterium]